MFKLFKYTAILFVFLILGCLVFYSVYPDLSILKTTNPKKTAFMEYREREWKKAGKKLKIHQKWVRYSRISPYMVKAVLIAEDDKFWSHGGFDFDAIEKAVEKDLKAGTFKVGASTISQQLVKNLYLSPSKNPARKIAEAFITWRMEKTISKKRILELYLNVAEWGEGIFGVQEAAIRFFGKPASVLTAEEACRLAAALPNPRRYTVNGASRFIERRSALIHRIMVRRGLVVPEYEEAEKEAAQEPPPTADEEERGRVFPTAGRGTREGE